MHKCQGTRLTNGSYTRVHVERPIFRIVNKLGKFSHFIKFEKNKTYSALETWRDFARRRQKLGEEEKRTRPRGIAPTGGWFAGEIRQTSRSCSWCWNGGGYGRMCSSTRAWGRPVAQLGRSSVGQDAEAKGWRQGPLKISGCAGGN